MNLLVTNVPFVACQVDPKLINPVDLVVCKKWIWVSVLKSNLVQKYDKNGKLIASLSVTSPTGLSTDSHSTLYVASENGSIYSLTSASSSTSPEVWTTVGGSLQGLDWLKSPVRMGSRDVESLLYVSVYDRGYVAVLKDKVPILSIVNEGLVSFNYKPLGIRALGDQIYITYSDGSYMPGSGYVDVYDPKKPVNKRLTNLVRRSNLSYPYGLAEVDNNLLVGNRATGVISSFDANKQYTLGQSSVFGGQINDGIMGLRVYDDLLYFVAANDNGAMGSLGYMDLASLDC